MRHIPYIDDPPFLESDPYQIYEKTICNDFAGEEFGSIGPGNTEPGEGCSTIPAHVFVLARSRSRDGYWIFIDTKRGTAVLADFQDGPEARSEVPFPQFSLVCRPFFFLTLSLVLDQGLKVPAKGWDDPEQWQGYNTYAISDFFEMLKEDYRQFRVVRKPDGWPFKPRLDNGKVG